jgi:hypothetical protein
LKKSCSPLKNVRVIIIILLPFYTHFLFLLLLLDHHKLIKKADKEQEKIRDKRLHDAMTFRNAQLDALNKKIETDLDAINKDVQVSYSFYYRYY